ncbi:hypothetical protein H7K45_29805 [Mycobacterium yunnanensis]|uniref:Rieske domain-containing protein n=1 Tax=Mycobacterium yunnanensis TaxID=368477 RepID=A0A9X2ZD71_9MYCO|nr:hypothetical protein [Mycobacterium yunnanensis]MCV7424742.1 hypothetical protein [Mycobacterium yunnanensis]
MSVVIGDLVLRSSSTGQHPSADFEDWTQKWVGVGLASELTEVGAVLPATIGHHAVHVRRTEDGLQAALNARPFGGCVSIPVHCGSTRNVRCPQRACAFSEDGGVLDGTTDPTGAARVGFLGDGRRVVRFPVAQWGPLLFVNVTMSSPSPLSIPGGLSLDDMEVLASARRLTSGNWLDTPLRAVSAVVTALSPGGTTIDVTTVAPNLAVARLGSDVLVAISRPAGYTRSTVLCGLLSRAATSTAIDPQSIDRLRW